MKNFKLKASVLAVSLAMSGAAFANITLDPDAGAKTYASELVSNGIAISDDGLDLGHALGFGVSATQTRFLRYDLTNATFSGTVVPSDLLIAAPGATVAVSTGGAANGSFVIFQITASGDLPQSAAVALALGSGGANGIKVTNVASSATIQYRLYETATAAVAAGTPLAAADGPLANFASGLALTPSTITTTADVTSSPAPYAKFKTTGTHPGITNVLAKVGNVIYGPVIGVVNLAGVQISQPELVAAGTKLVVSGLDLSALSTIATNKLFLDNGDECATSSLESINKTSTTAEFVTNTTAFNVIPGRNVCFTANGTTPIAVQDFTVAASVVPATNTTTANIAAKALGAFDHDGTVLKVPFSQGTAGQTTFINLANMGSVDAPFTTRCFTGPGTGAPTAGVVATVLAGNTKKLKSTDLLCAAGTNAVEFTLAVPSGTVVGTFVRQNNTTGDSGMSDVTGNQ